MSKHFNFLVFVTLIYLGLFLKFATPIHSNTWEQGMAARSHAFLWGLHLTGGYLATCALIFGHALLRSPREKNETVLVYPPITEGGIGKRQHSVVGHPGKEVLQTGRSPSP